MQCTNHPEREAIAVCQKFGYAYCSECCSPEDGGAPRCACTSPETHCRYRQECLVHHLSRKRSEQP